MFILDTAYMSSILIVIIYNADHFCIDKNCRRCK